MLLHAWSCDVGTARSPLSIVCEGIRVQVLYLAVPCVRMADGLMRVAASLRSSPSLLLPLSPLLACTPSPPPRYDRARKEYGAEGNFPSVYDKTAGGERVDRWRAAEKREKSE